MKALFLSAALAALSLGATAQTTFSIIPQVGANFSTLRRTIDNEKYKSGTQAGIRAGLDLGIGFGEQLSIQPGVYFSQKGGSNTNDKTVTANGITTVTSGKFQTHINYVEVPLNVVYYFNNSQSGFFLNAGGYFGLAVSANEEASVNGSVTSNGTTTTYTSTGKTDLKIGGDEAKDDIRRFDVGAQAGAGYQTKMGLMFRAQYILGGMNIVASDNSANSMRNGTAAVTIGYKIGG